jgi:hypothetical protein
MICIFLKLIGIKDLLIKSYKDNIPLGNLDEYIYDFKIFKIII